MSGNRAVTYIRPGEVAVRDIPYPKLEIQDGPGVNPANVGRKCNHGAILKVVTTNICGSDQHMVRGRTTAPAGLVLGHEILGEVIETGPDVEFIEVGDLCSVPFNIACGRCRNCKAGKTGVCLNVNPDRPGSAYGYVDMGGWVGGQAEYVMVPYADFNLLRLPDRDQAMAKVRDLTMLSDIFPTGFHGAVTAGVRPGSTVYIAGGGPVGLAAAVSAQLLGAAVVIVGDVIERRLAQARSFGCATVDVSQGEPGDQVAEILGVPEVDAAVDAVGFEARGHGAFAATEAPATVLNSLMRITAAGGAIGVPGLYVTEDPGPRRRRRRGQGWLVVAKPRNGVGEVAVVHYRAVPGDALQPRSHDGDLARPRPDREGGGRDGDLARRRPPRLSGIRSWSREEVRYRSARNGCVATETHAPSWPPRRRSDSDRRRVARSRLVAGWAQSGRHATSCGRRAR